MRILYLGDIVGDRALETITSNIARIRQEQKLNLIFANAENVCGGRGLNKVEYLALQKAGISVLTMGNHTYSKKEIIDFIDNSNIVRPANLVDAPGKGYLTIKYNTQTITIISLLGRVFTNSLVDCPFQTLAKILATVKSDYYIVDFHAEATSEKLALAYAFKNQIQALVGTHTHVQTADERNIEGTLYITDLGMCGPQNSIIGDDIESIITRFKTGVYKPSKVADGPIILQGAILDFTKKKIERYREFFNVKN